MKIIKKIEKWQKDRLLDKQEYNWSNEAVNIVEEIIEAYGYKVPKEKRETLKNAFEKFVNAFIITNKLEPTDDNNVDALFDICVFAIGAMMKLGYDPTCVFKEGLKEIESRTGSIVNGKFQKDTSQEAKSKWYKANYNKCKKIFLYIEDFFCKNT